MMSLKIQISFAKFQFNEIWYLLMEFYVNHGHLHFILGYDGSHLFICKWLIEVTDSVVPHLYLLLLTVNKNILPDVWSSGFFLVGSGEGRLVEQHLRAFRLETLSTWLSLVRE